jgi:hypothetical protein
LTKLADDKSLLSKGSMMLSGRNSKETVKGIHGVPVLKLYGKKLMNNDNSIDRNRSVKEEDLQ